MILNWSLKFLDFFGTYLAKTHFYSKQNCQNKLKGVFVKYFLKPKFLLLKKIANQTKALAIDLTGLT
jgi:hypothetical protein